MAYTAINVKANSFYGQIRIMPYGTWTRLVWRRLRVLPAASCPQVTSGDCVGPAAVPSARPAAD